MACPHIDQASVELNAGHRGHMNVGDQACGFGKTRGSEEIGCRREILDGIAQRPHEPRHGRAMESIIVNNRDERRFRHGVSGTSSEPIILSHPLISSHYLGQRIPPSNIHGRKLWFTPLWRRTQLPAKYVPTGNAQTYEMTRWFISAKFLSREQQPCLTKTLLS